MTKLLPNISLLVTTKQLTIILIVTASVFAVFIAAAVIKMYKLKAENRKLLDSNPFEVDSDSSDFQEGHLYEN
ncbi:hypothetical protein RM697_08965 [Ichthyenterobacterium sp. W332]|uniref:Uncharacterized protein n=1 Tax=Microcosmobacter mediterraneus TaxID=3075607 RepID=A0ABU2YL44_9FLAO|nr:hypothetical protein [Ichthyenterobacterium sp. W332]MDT0558777.1 hypothetical protein [Ichthyenterobacterium sp. W332]